MPAANSFTRKPQPHESFVIRLAMLIGGILFCVVGLVVAFQGHWLALLAVVMGGLILWGWWEAVQQAKAAGEPIRLTERAANQIKQMMANEPDPDRTLLRIELVQPGRQGVKFVTTHDPRREQVVVSRGIRIVILRSQLEELRGTEVDFRTVEGAGQGFSFHHKSNEKK
jgi:Fe-S cluster assembly iron-binding protein IscA